MEPDAPLYLQRVKASPTVMRAAKVRWRLERDLGYPREDSAPDQTRSGSDRKQSSGGIPAPPAGTRFDGGPEEGTRGAPTAATRADAAVSTRFDGGPEGGSRGPAR